MTESRGQCGCHVACENQDEGPSANYMTLVGNKITDFHSYSSDLLTKMTEPNLDSDQASGNHSNEAIPLQREHPSPYKNADFTVAHKKVIATEGLSLIDYLLNAPRGEAIEIDRPKDLIRNIGLGEGKS